MFSGIIEELGVVKKIWSHNNLTVLEIKTQQVWADTKKGDSIAVNGVCLTVVKKEKDILSFEVMPQTSKISNLGLLSVSDKVNLERSLMMGERISGHFVSGHVDYLGTIRRKAYRDGNLCFEITLPSQYQRFISSKGSVSVDGISLTVVEKRSDLFSVYIIAHTLKNTTLGFKGPSHKVNVELDILAKYSKG